MAERKDIEATRRILANVAKAFPLLCAIVEDMQIAADAFIEREEARDGAAKDLLAQAREVASEDGENHSAPAVYRPIGGTVIEGPAVVVLHSSVQQPPVLHLVPDPIERPAVAPLSAEDQERVAMAAEDPNPFITNDPRAWLDAGGDSQKGHRLGECPPAYLDLMAEGLTRRADYWAKHRDAAPENPGKEAADRRLAKLAREHAARQRPRAQHTTISADDILKGRART